ncbi:MAG: hypothetical protein ACP5OA_04115 [Candidatus Woesearchaeota archaeon]
MINETISSVGIVMNTTWNYLSTDLFNRSRDMIEAPARIPEMLWMLLPLLATLILMESYFGRYKDEELGWNTAFGNALVLMFVAIDLFRHLYEPTGSTVLQFIATATEIKIIVPLLVALMALILIFIDFFHFIPKKIAYIMSSPIYINLIGLLGIIVVYTANIPLDWTTVFACFILFIIANLITLLLYYIIPSYKPTIRSILTADDIEKYSEELNKKKDKKNK